MTARLSKNNEREKIERSDMMKSLDFHRRMAYNKISKYLGGIDYE